MMILSKWLQSGKASGAFLRWQEGFAKFDFEDFEDIKDFCQVWRSLSL
jgi:hypothetical protein